MGILYAIVTVAAWGIWLAPSQRVQFKSQQLKIFYVALANLVLATIVGLFKGGNLFDIENFLLPFIGGLIWVFGGLCAFTATNKIGIAKAFGIWAPLNIIVSIVWGMILFEEFLKSGSINLMLAAFSVVLIITGTLFVIFAGGDKNEGNAKAKNGWIIGLAGALGAGIFWGSYFIPVRISALSMWVAAFPMAVGMFIGSALLVLLNRSGLRLERTSDYFPTAITGLLWGIGNYGALLMMEVLGTGKGFTIAQLCVVVNALVGILWLKEPHPKTKAAKLTFLGVVVAAVGGVLLGYLK